MMQGEPCVYGIYCGTLQAARMTLMNVSTFNSLVKVSNGVKPCLQLFLQADNELTGQHSLGRLIFQPLLNSLFCVLQSVVSSFCPGSYMRCCLSSCCSI